jgi:GTPase Era involved in 16S rRNA processing
MAKSYYWGMDLRAEIEGIVVHQVKMQIMFIVHKNWRGQKDWQMDKD